MQPYHDAVDLSGSPGGVEWQKKVRRRFPSRKGAGCDESNLNVFALIYRRRVCFSSLIQGQLITNGDCDTSQVGKQAARTPISAFVTAQKLLQLLTTAQ